MQQRIIDSLDRQVRAIALLGDLEREEFAHLTNLDPTAVASVEFSIQELIRQIHVERSSMKRLYAAYDVTARRLTDILGHFDPEARARAEALLAALDRGEQECAKQGDKNYRVALGLYDQSRAQIEFIQDKLAPKKTAYAQNGRYAKKQGMPQVLSGRF